MWEPGVLVGENQKVTGNTKQPRGTGLYSVEVRVLEF